MRRAATRAWTRSASRSRTSTPIGALARRATRRAPIDAVGDAARRPHARAGSRGSARSIREDGTLVRCLAEKLFVYALGRGVESVGRAGDRRDRRARCRSPTRRSRDVIMGIVQDCEAVPAAVSVVTVRRLSRRAVPPRRRRRDRAAVARIAMARAASAGDAAPSRGRTRALFVFAPNGEEHARLDARREGRRLRAAASSSRSRRIAAKLLVLSGLALDGAQRHGDGPGDHARAIGGVPHRRAPVQDRRREHPRRHLGRPGDRRARSASDTRSRRSSSAASTASRPATATPATAAPTRQHLLADADAPADEGDRIPRLAFERLFGGPDDGLAAGGSGGAAPRPRERPRLRRSTTRSGSRPRLGTDRPPQARRVPDVRPRGRGADPKRVAAGPRRRTDVPAARRRRRRLRRARAAHVRPGGARVPGRPHARRDVHVRQRGQQPQLPVPRRPRGPPRALAPRRRPGEDREDQEDQPLPHRAVRALPREARRRPAKATARCSTTRSSSTAARSPTATATTTTTSRSCSPAAATARSRRAPPPLSRRTRRSRTSTSRCSTA